MTLYLTLEDGSKKIERILDINEDKASDHDKYGEIIEQMVHSMAQHDCTLMPDEDCDCEKELLTEAKRLTQHND